MQCFTYLRPFTSKQFGRASTECGLSGISLLRYVGHIAVFSKAKLWMNIKIELIPQKSYWVGQSAVASTTGEENAGAIVGGENEKFFEPGPPDAKAGIRIKGLTKRFKKKVAVNNLSFEMYENQITALLGHNGAGKTTTMSMLTGETILIFLRYMFIITSGKKVNDFFVFQGSFLQRQERL